MHGGRRRAGRPGGYKVSIPAQDVAAHGAGYPLTYRFTVPAGVVDVVAQWRQSSRSGWSFLAAAPSGRFDGVDGVVRLDGTSVYVSKAFPPGVTEIDLRVVDGAGAEVGTFADVQASYDARTPLVYTYDDNMSTALWEASTAAHRAARIWMSPGIVSGTLDTTPTSPPNLSAQGVRDGVQAGYVEPINHSYSHVNGALYTGQEQADSEIIGGRDALLAATPMPSQSRGRVHGYIYPNGNHNPYAYTACAAAGHLSGRLVIDEAVPVTSGTYSPGVWDATYGMVTQQTPSVGPLPGQQGTEAAPAEQEAGAQKVLAAVAHAKSVGGQCIVYSYIRHWDWSDGSPWRTMLDTVGAMTDIWSVGYGHLALYRRTRDRVTVTDMTA